MPGNGPRFVQTSESTSFSQTRWRSHSPTTLPSSLTVWTRLDEPLQGTDRHVVAEMFGDVGEVDHRPVRDPAEDVRRVVTRLEVFVVGEPEPLVLEVVGDAA